MGIRRHRVPNRALAAAATAGLAVSVEAWASGAGNVGLWVAGIGFWIQDAGFWTAAVKGAAIFIMRLMSAAAAGFPFFLLRTVGAGDIRFMILAADCFGLERGFWPVVIGLYLGIVLVLGRMLREGNICRRFLYLTAYIRYLIQNRGIEVYYCLEWGGYKCVIPLGACFFTGTLISALWKEQVMGVRVHMHQEETG